MNIETRGLVIREQTIGESDRLVTLLTADYGIVRAFVRRAKQLKSRMASSTSLFSYANYSLYRKKDAFVVNNASPIEVFFDLRKDIERLALAQYFAQLVYDLGESEQPAQEMLKLTLNALHLLCKGTKSNKQIKAVFELRLMCLGGYMPQLLACKNCSVYETEHMFFSIDEGCIYCDDCQHSGAVFAAKNVVTAMRFICLTEPARIFSFSLSDENMNVLCTIAEQYVLSRVQRKLSTLDFYKHLCG